MARPGTFPKGKSGNLKGRPPVHKEIRELAKEHTAEAFARLVALMRSEDDKVALAASNSILDRGWGRPHQSLEVTGEDGGPLVAQILVVPQKAPDA